MISRLLSYDPTAPHAVVETPISDLTNTIINIDELATPCRFRFLDCTSLVDSNVLRIIEYPVASSSLLEGLSFAAVSYPWRDLQMPANTTPPKGSFSVKGAEHADQISIDVMQTACLAALHFGISMLWMDRLCILQSRKDDKNWQIQRMFWIYSHCNLCLILPGGLVRLAALSEPTTWIDRAWTLQEASAPGRDKLKCIFSFTHATYAEFLQQMCEGVFSPKFLEFLNHTPNPLQAIIEPGRSAACDLMELFRLMSGGVAGFKYHEPTLSERHDRFPVRIIYTPAARLLQRALKTGRSGQYLWMSAFSRSSSRPVDMVFSLMDLLGVSLEVSQFGAQERARATIKLIQELMNRRQRATWLYIAPAMPASREISTLPAMPETSESGRAFIHTRDRDVLAFEAIGDQELWQPEGAPKGVMYDSGYFRFYARAALVVRAIRFIDAMDDGITGVHCSKGATTRAYDNRQTWAIEIGRRKELNRDPESGQIKLTPKSAGPPAGVIEITLMFVENHGYNLFHRVGMEKEIDEKKTADWTWIYGEFNVGGPGRGGRERFKVTPGGPVCVSGLTS